MIRYLLLLLTFMISGCTRDESAKTSDSVTTDSTLQNNTMHPKVDFAHWANLFPLKSGEKADGKIITSPAHLCEIELVRKRYEKDRDLGRAVPVDIFLWSTEPPIKPYLTKIGGVPHRESTAPWPTDASKPFTFVAQFCFADSRDIVSDRIPNDVMLIFFKNADALYEEDSIHVEWSSIRLDSPITADQCPPPSFTVPKLSGHIYRTNEYPESWSVFEQAGHGQCYLFPTTQSTKIGRETFFTQNDPRGPTDELLCALNSVHPTTYPPGAKWPFIGLETLPDDWNKPDDDYEWGKYRMMFADVGCMYFLIDRQGKVTWTWDSY